MIPEEEARVLELLWSLEQQMMDPEFRKDAEEVSALLGKEFREFGSSGQVFDKDAIIDLLAKEARCEPPRVTEFEVRLLGRDVALVTYRTERVATPEDAAQSTLRSSLWVREDSVWKLAFHQGTKAAN